MGNEFAPDNGLKTRKSEHFGIDEQAAREELKKRVNTTIHNIDVPVGRWLEYSNKDMEAMEHMAKLERLDLAFFFLQQSLEKSLKAVWISKDIPFEQWVEGELKDQSKTHNLRTLAYIVLDFDGKLFKWFKDLTKCYFDRYPDAGTCNGYPWENHKKETYENYLENGHYTQGLIYLELGKLEELDELLGKMREGERKEELEKRKPGKPPSDDSWDEFGALSPEKNNLRDYARRVEGLEKKEIKMADLVKKMEEEEHYTRVPKYHKHNIHLCSSECLSHERHARKGRKGHQKGGIPAS